MVQSNNRAPMRLIWMLTVIRLKDGMRREVFLPFIPVARIMPDVILVYCCYRIISKSRLISNLPVCVCGGGNRLCCYVVRSLGFIRSKLRNAKSDIFLKQYTFMKIFLLSII